MGLDQVVYIEKDEKHLGQDKELFYWRKNHSLHNWLNKNICINTSIKSIYEAPLLNSEEWMKSTKPKARNRMYPLYNGEKLYLNKEDINKLFIAVMSKDIDDAWDEYYFNNYLDFIKNAHEVLNDGNSIYYVADW